MSVDPDRQLITSTKFHKIKPPSSHSTRTIHSNFLVELFVIHDKLDVVLQELS